MPWFLNPSAYAGLPFYQNPEFYLFVLKLLVTGLFVVKARRRGVRGRRLLASTWVFFYGLFLTVMLSTHSLVILGLRLFERPAGTPFVYDFKLYALLLVGAAFISQGLRHMRAAVHLSNADGEGRREALRATYAVLGLAVPLIPLQFFGVVLTAGGLVSLAAVFLLLPSATAALSVGRSAPASATA